ncbi:MAG: E3 binding domain-containing protein, partial [Caldilineaceae bacterium]
MATPVIMPKFGMAQEDGTIIRWLKQEGDRVEKGETLLEVQTDKVDMEVESPANGVLRDIRFGKDVTVAVTTVIAVVANEADEARIHAGEPLAPAPMSSPLSGPLSGPIPEPSGPPGAAQARGESRATPVAQRVAQAHGVSLEGVAGSGPAGRIVRADVERAGTGVEAPAPIVSSLLRATPAARRLAGEAGISLTAIIGSGPSGRVQAADVQAAALEPEKAAPISPETRPTGGP